VAEPKALFYEPVHIKQKEKDTEIVMLMSILAYHEKRLSSGAEGNRKQ